MAQASAGSGVDIAHPDLAPALWTHPGETPGNGLDDDGNGYVDDVHGWSFLGGADGQNVHHERLEVTRLVAACRATPEPADACATYEAAYAAKIAEAEAGAAQILPLYAQMARADSTLRVRFPDTYDAADPGALDTGLDLEAGQAQRMLAFMAAQGAALQDVADYADYLTDQIEYNLNPEYDPRGLVGDDPADPAERLYGNADVAGPDPSHGTGVAGLVAAIRGNGDGIDGVAPNTAERAPVRIMALRAVPDGDERDKDIANAIRYAADHGAHIINMSFGKGFSPNKAVVDEAVAYAIEKGALLVHASGNDGADLETEANFPSRRYADGTDAAAWLTVGASTHDATALAAPFSNYGTTRVDLFAPGARVTSLEPGGGTSTHDGTSFAAPVVAGVAALVMAYAPTLSAADVRQILLDSATPLAETQTPRPGMGDPVAFGSLSVSGGVVNAAEAVRLALAQSASQGG